MTDKARELLERALGLLEGSYYQDLVEEIRAHLAAEKGKQDQEPVAWGVMQVNGKRPWYLSDSKSVCQGYADHYSHRTATGPSQVVVPLFLHPSPQAEQRKPLSKEDLEAGWKSYRMTRLDIYLEQRSFVAGIRFAEKHHKIGGGDE